ncbi:FAD-dependent monooxygenase [Candidatus Dojkabacteria bacterium]|uniref:FAD-dependent monooxygenase n=1 Tax=Candidatus Dojkabacteria bacterium TaxID=2099670 RepID=A0A955RKE1_9BACT|nr:FAD-dependent monooxygenase [Candidatus Dojkabacteria bacterium]
MQSQRTAVKVLIIGAGPSGLFLAAKLTQFGIPFRIIDKHPGPSSHSKALVVDARSLELFETLGIARDIVDNGKVIKGTQVFTSGRFRGTIPIAPTNPHITPYPYLVLIEQYKIEELLSKFLENSDQHVNWNSELLDFAQDTQKVFGRIKMGNDEIYEIESEWLVAADGSKSSIRHMLNLEFRGKTYSKPFFLADTEIDNNYSRDELLFGFSKHGFSGLFPLPNSENVYRVFGILHGPVSRLESLPIEQIEHSIQRNTHLPIKLSKLSMNEVYRVHKRIIDNYRHGRVFFIGDAAHTMSLLGGQAMNTGIQDAANLSWKLSLVTQKISPDSLLNTYSQERRVVLAREQKQLDTYIQALLADNTFKRLFRQSVSRILAEETSQRPWLQNKIFKEFSQLTTHYNQSDLTSEYKVKESFTRTSPKAGDRLPPLVLTECRTNQKISLASLLQGNFHHLFYLPAKKDWMEHLSELRILMKQYSNSISLHTVFADQGASSNEFKFYNDSTQEFYARCGVKSSAFILLRPDGYIAYRSKIDIPNLEEFLNKLFLS